MKKSSTGLATAETERIRIRPARANDNPALIALFTRLGKETKYMRFMKYRRSISSRELSSILDTCGDTVALVAEIYSGVERILIADGRFVVDGTGESAEVGIVVQDEYQRMGIGRRMLEMLVAEARRRGVRYFTGDILANNFEMLNFIQKTGYDFEFEYHGPIRHFLLDLHQIAVRHNRESVFTSSMVLTRIHHMQYDGIAS